MSTETNFRKMLAVVGALALSVPALSAVAKEQEDDCSPVCDADSEPKDQPQ